MRRTYFDWFLITMTVITFGGGLVYLLYFWDSIPAMVPLHFGLNGEINGFDSKYMIFAIVVLESVLIGTVAVTSFIPKFWNVPNGADYPLVRNAVKVMLEIMALAFALYFTGMYVIVSQALIVPAWFFKSFVIIVVVLSFSPFPFAVIARLKSKR